jgi:hypothetical protein
MEKMKLFKNNYNITEELSNKNSIKIIICLIISGLIIRFYFTPFDLPISLDAISYFLYTVAIQKEGYFPTGYLASNFGWSTFLAPIFWIVDSNEMLELMNVQRIMSSIISVSTAIPIYFICKIFFKKNIAILGVVLFLFDPRIIENSILGITDPLFIFFVTLTIMFVFIKESKFFYLSFIFVALAGFTRYEGLLLIIPILVSFFVRRNFEKLTIIKLIIGIILFISIIMFINVTAYENSNLNIGTPIFGGINFISSFVLVDNSNSKDEVSAIDTENKTQLFASNAITTYLMYLAWIMIPILGLFIIPGFFLTKKKITKNKITLFIFMGVISLAPLFAYGRGIEETRYLYPLFPILILFSCQFFDYLSKKWNIKIIIITVISISIILSSMFLEYNKEDYEYEKEMYNASLFLSNEADGVNNYNGNKYIAVAELQNNWPELIPKGENGIMLGNIKKFTIDDFDNPTEYIEFNKNNGLTHLLIKEENRNGFFDDVFHNENKYPILEKIVDSRDLGIKTKYKIFKINNEE